MRTLDIRIEALRRLVAASERMILLHRRRIEFCRGKIEHLSSKQKDQLAALKKAGLHADV